MAVMHTPESLGVKAKYARSEDENGAGYDTLERDVYGWDKLGRPLVMCGERLETVELAQFESYRRFVKLVKPEGMENFADKLIWGTNGWCTPLIEVVRDLIRDLFCGVDLEQVIKTAVREELATRQRDNMKGDKACPTS